MARSILHASQPSKPKTWGVQWVWVNGYQRGLPERAGPPLRLGALERWPLMIYLALDIEAWIIQRARTPREGDVVTVRVFQRDDDMTITHGAGMTIFYTEARQEERVVDDKLLRLLTGKPYRASLNG